MDRPSPTRHASVEVFSARLLGSVPRKFRNYFGVMLLHRCDPNYAIFESSLLEPPLVDSKGYITLTGPEHSIPVNDEIVIYPWLIDARLTFMHTDDAILWRTSLDSCNSYICRKIFIMHTNYLQMHFAVYDDAVEAHLDVSLVNMDGADADEPLQIHGTVSASNSVVSHPEARSYLFHKGSREYVSLKHDKFIPLPLSRRMVVVPRDSTLHVDVSIAIGSRPEDASIAGNTIKYTAVSNFPKDGTLISDCGKVSVKVTWKECEDHV